MDIISYILSRNYTNVSLEGMGAIKGKNCTIKAIQPVEGGNEVIFSWTTDSGTEQTSTLTVLNGEKGDTGEKGLDGLDGKSIVNIEILDDNSLSITLSDNTIINAGTVKTVSGFSPAITENPDNTDEIYKLDVTNESGTFTTPNLKGNASIDDNNISESSTWSSSKISEYNSVWKGTKAEYELIKDTLKEGTFVYITDDDNDGDILDLSEYCTKTEVGEYIDDLQSQINLKCGKQVANEKFTVNNKEITAGKGAEIFNDYDENIATGGYSSCFGKKNTVTGAQSFAFGNQNTVSGGQSGTYGVLNEASNTTSFAGGFGCKATQYGAVSMGSYATSSGQSSASFNSGQATGAYSFATNNKANASGVNATAHGFFTNASGENSFVSGTGKATNGTEDTTIGAIGKASTAIGNQTTAKGENAVSIGSNTNAARNNSFAGGVDSVTQGLNSFSFGSHCQANADNSFALGEEAVVPNSAFTSVAIGDHVTAPGSARSGTTAFGCYNNVSHAISNGIGFVYGNGNAQKSSNAFGITYDGRIYIGYSDIFFDGTYNTLKNKPNSYFLTNTTTDIQITASTKLNNCLTTGTYTMFSTVDVSNITDIPSGLNEPFKMTVETVVRSDNSNNLIQRILTKSGVEYYRYISKEADSDRTYGEWKRVITSDEYQNLLDRVTALENA